MDKQCPYCGEVNEPLGKLGNRVHYRCRACGIEYSHSSHEEYDEPENY